MSLKKNPSPLSKTFFSSAIYWTGRVFWDFTESVKDTGEIPARSHVRLGVFFRKSPKPNGSEGVKSYVMTVKDCLRIVK